jgi:precorrin-2 dehydrogenase/sirohydrochlorin ferrochelatase
LGSIVTKGDLKIGISTNGKSPTMAKRIRQLFEKYLPEDLPGLLTNMNLFRKTLKGDFSSKVKILNQLTEDLVKNNEETKEEKPGKGPQLSIASYRRYITTGLPAHWGN